MGKVAAFKKPQQAEKEKQTKGKRNQQNTNGYYQEEERPQRIVLSREQRITLSRIPRSMPECNIEHVLPTIITDMEITRFNPNDNTQKIGILDSLLIELQDAMLGKSKKSKKLKTTKNAKSKAQQVNKK